MTPRKRCYSWLALFLAWALLPAPLPAAIVQTGDVAPAVHTWWFNTFGYIGSGSVGSVTVDAGSLLASRRGYLGNYIGATGTATVTGVGSLWTIYDFLYVGVSGNGTLAIEAGGEVDSRIAYLGYNSNSTGTVTVTGAGSKWTHNGWLPVGDSGNGMLIIEAGGQVTNPSVGYLGYKSGSTGTARVTGAGSKWTNGGSLSVGYSGNGTLTIEAGGEVSNTSGSLGYSYGYSSRTTNKVTVTGAGSKWTNAGSLDVGPIGRGTLTIEDGGLVSVGELLAIDYSSHGNSFINMTTGGMLALRGDADESLSQFLELVSGNDDAIRFWNESLSDWAPLTTATLGVDYTLEYLTAGDLVGYTLLTVGDAISPALEGDFNGDGSVDGTDFLVWQRGQSPDLLSAADLSAWKTNFGAGSGTAEAASAAVPEPTTGALVLLIPLAFSMKRRRLRPLHAV